MKLAHMVIAAVILFVLVGCTEPPTVVSQRSKSMARALADDMGRKYGVHPTQDERVWYASVPKEVESDQWGVVSDAMSDSGFSLQPALGEQVTLTGFRLEEKLEGQPVDLVVMQKGSETLGAYLLQHAGTPGVYSLKQADRLE